MDNEKKELEEEYIEVVGDDPSVYEENESEVE